MAGNSGTQDWFYHAPTKSDDKQAVDYPAASQIPLIGGELLIAQDRDESGTKRGWLRETDSKYVRLAKMGGRKDLLSMRSPSPKSDGPKTYPRVDWFDHQEVEEQEVDTGPRKVYQPDYMVHESYDSSHPTADTMGESRPPVPRAPYSLQDGISAFKRDGVTVTDKTLNLKEEVPHSKRFAKKDKKSDVKQRNKALVERRESLGQKQKNVMRVPDEPVIFNKLMSMGYQHEWNEQREKYYDQQKKRQDMQPSYKTQADVGKNKEPVTTEYREEINKTGKQNRNVNMTKRSEHNGNVRQVTSVEAEGDERYGTITTRIDSHWSHQRRTSDTHRRQLDMTRVEI